MNPRLKALILSIGVKGLKQLTPAVRAEMLIQPIRELAQDDSPEQAVRFLFELDRRLYTLQGQTSVRYGNGIHTKHHHINYHQFFVTNLKPGERVLDIGTGNGFLAYDMATQVKGGVQVVGIEMSASNIQYAREHYKHPNLHFIQGDALTDLPNEKFDVVTLSNVLEHIEQRVEFLKNVMYQIRPKRLIVRVPMFERDWRVPLKKELGMDYRLDGTHCIEYLQEEFFEELDQSGLKPTHTEFRWGEIWSVVEPLSEGDHD